MNSPDHTPPREQVTFAVWGGWAATIVSGILGAVVGAVLGGREVLPLRRELREQRLALEQRSVQLQQATETAKLHAEALAATRAELERLRAQIPNASGSGIVPLITTTCSERKRRLPDPQSSSAGVHIVKVLVPPNGCWSEPLALPVGYKLGAVSASRQLEMKYPIKMRPLLRPEQVVVAAVLDSMSVAASMTLRANTRVELAAPMLPINSNEVVRFRSKGPELAAVTLFFKSE